MKKGIWLINIVIILLSAMSAQTCSISDSKSRYLWNEEGIYILLYSSLEDCENNSMTNSYLLNGFPIDYAITHDCNDHITAILFGDSEFYFKSLYITEELPDNYVGKNKFWITEAMFLSIPIEYLVFPDAFPNWEKNELEKLEAAQKVLYEVYGFVEENFIYLEETGFYLRKNEATSIRKFLSDCEPLWGMIDGQRAIQNAKDFLLSIYPEFSADRLKIKSVFSLAFKKPDDSYCAIYFFPEDEWHDVYFVQIDAVDGSIIEYKYTEEDIGIG